MAAFCRKTCGMPIGRWAERVRPTGSPGVFRPSPDAADLVTAGLAAQNEDAPFRAVIQMADDLAREHGAERVVLTVNPPRSTGDVRFDAFLAGVVELRLDEERLPHPKWLAKAPRLAAQWFVADRLEGDQVTINATPTQLRARGVIIDAAELVSA